MKTSLKSYPQGRLPGLFVQADHKEQVNPFTDQERNMLKMIKLKLKLPEEKQAVLDKLMASYGPASGDTAGPDPDALPVSQIGRAHV